MSYFTKRYHAPGTSPGTLVDTTGAEPPGFSIRLVDYTESEFIELELEDAHDCSAYLQRDSITWIHVQGCVEAQTLRELGNLFGLHPLALEDVLNTGQRAKADSYDEQLFVVVNLPVMEEGTVNSEQVSLFLGHRYLISFHNGKHHPFEPVLKRLRKHSGRIRSRGTDYLLYALIDVIIDSGFPVLEQFGEQIEDLEEELLDDPGRDTLAQIHHTKRELLTLRRMLWPQRELINMMLREEQPHIAAETHVYLRDCYDHTVQIMELIESYREMSASMLDVYLSSVSHRLNEVMKVLTVIATIFIPLTFLVGVYGMNFGARQSGPWAMPELDWAYGYPVLWLLMIAIAGGMVAYFRRRNWF